MGVISNKLRNRIQKVMDSYFLLPNDQQLVAMICDSVMFTLAVLWLCVVGYKDNVDNAKELFKSALVNEPTRSFRPPKLDATPNTLLDNNNDNVGVQVCDNEKMFSMVNVNSPNQDIDNGASVAFNTVTPNDLTNEAFKEWILLKVDWLAWFLNKQKMDKINKNKVHMGNSDALLSSLLDPLEGLSMLECGKLELGAAPDFQH
jgi:hypothetical protein